MRLWLTAALAMTGIGAVCADVTVGANGGIIRAAGDHQFELVVKPQREVRETPIVLFITDRDGKPVETKDARGHADFSSGGLKGRATLHADGANRMKGYGLMSAKPDLLIDVSISFPGHASLHAQFKPLDQTGRSPTPQ